MLSSESIEDLLQRLREDQRRRWLAGDQKLVESYLAEHVELASQSEVVLDFVYGEYMLAEELGFSLSSLNYLSRFPQFAAELRTLFEVHDAFKNDLIPRAPAFGDQPITPEGLRCPSCAGLLSSAEVHADGSVECPGCRQFFRLAQRDAVPEGASLKHLGRFELLEVVGQGGFGIVYRARDRMLQRFVAIKIPYSRQFGSQVERERFVREARSAAQLQHPGIVSVLEVGSEPIPYLVSEFVEGATLADAMTRRSWSPHDAARMVLRISEALEHAHSHGIVHRDLKPSNIMLADGDVPRLVDFGLAKRDTNDMTLTGDGQLLGTPAYMSPEQAAGDRDHVDARCDVYSLGVVLYQLITGELPFRGNQRNILWQLQYDEPQAPRRLNDRVPNDLETICLKAMSKEQARRYQSAQKLADDLARFLVDQPILARPERPWERARRSCRRNPVAATLAIAAVMILFAGTLVSTLFAIQAKRSSVAARTQTNLLRNSLYAKNLNLAQYAWDSANISRLTQLLDACPEDQRGWEWEFWRQRVEGDLRTLGNGQSPIQQNAWNPCNTLVAAADQHGRLQVWNGLTGELCGSVNAHHGEVNCLAFNPDGTMLVTGGSDRVIHFWKVDERGRLSSEPINSIAGDQGPVLSVAFSPSGNLIASAGVDQPVRIWDVRSSSQTKTLGRNPGTTRHVSFDPEGKLLAIATGEGIVELVDIASSELKAKFPTGDSIIEQVAFSPDGRHVAAAGSSRTITLWDLQGNLTRTMHGHSHAVLSLSFSADNGLLASAGRDHTVRLWDYRTGAELQIFKGHLGMINSVHLHPQDSLLASGGDDGKIKIWEVADDPKRSRSDDHPFVEGVAFAPDSRLVASVDSRGSIRLWDAETRGELQSLFAGDHATRAMAFDPVNAELACVDDDGMVRMWDVAARRIARVFPAPLDFSATLAFEPRGGRLAVAAGNEVMFFDRNGREVAGTCASEEPIRSISLSSDATLLATGGFGGTVSLWTLPTRRRLQRLSCHHGSVESVSISRDGKRLLTGSGDGTAGIWDIESGQRIQQLRGHTSGVNNAEFSPDERRVVTVSNDRTAKIWDTASGTELLSIECPERADACFSPDGRWIAINAGDGQLALHDSNSRTYDEKVAGYLARRVVVDHPLVSDALAKVDAEERWTPAIRAAVKRVIRELGCQPAQGASRALGLASQGSAEELQAARTLVARLQELDPADVEHRVINAAVEWKSGNASRALALLPAPAEINDPWHAFLYGLVHATLDRTEERDLRLHELARSVFSNSQSTVAYRAFCERALDDLTSQARQCYRNHELPGVLSRYDFSHVFRPLEIQDAVLYAEVLALDRRWSEASQVLGAAQLQQDDWVNHANCALMSLAAGDSQTYRRMCRRLLPAHFDTNNESAALVIGLTCTLGEDSIGDPKLVLHFIEQSKSLSGVAPVRQLLLGTAEYRVGNLERAQKTLSGVYQMLSLTSNLLAARMAEDRVLEIEFSRLCCATMLAEIYVRLGREPQALTAAREAKVLIERMDQAPISRQGRLASWNARCAAEIGRRQLRSLSTSFAPLEAEQTKATATSLE